MKQFKLIDFWVSIWLIFIALICIPISGGAAFIIGYFGISSWHIISMVIHFFNKWFLDKSNGRCNYHWTVFTIILLALIGILLRPILWFVAIVMLFASPIMIIIYTNMCFEEIQKLKNPNINETIKIEI